MGSVRSTVWIRSENSSRTARMRSGSDLETHMRIVSAYSVYSVGNSLGSAFRVFRAFRDDPTRRRGGQGAVPWPTVPALIRTIFCGSRYFLMAVLTCAVVSDCTRDG